MRTTAANASPIRRGDQSDKDAGPSKPASAVSEEASVRELVESCLANNDTLPLVRA